MSVKGAPKHQGTFVIRKAAAYIFKLSGPASLDDDGDPSMNMAGCFSKTFGILIILQNSLNNLINCLCWRVNLVHIYISMLKYFTNAYIFASI